ncbi:hypothetical protein CLM69_18340 [Serratia marcescens]|nr:hypothetical protein AM478_19985 [Serratia marcescens]AWC69072.1 hypothetical protein AM368_01925 [Serratia marcescens]AWC91480.1 hypothetical protein AM370_22040 [Serratia marcescens]AWS60789.1 hypothetical protein AM369_21975 [Serratia marcescens]AWS67687.1 hypothetical protein AM378_04470 [Serratia marcescens]
MARPFLCTENPQLGWGFRKAYSFEYAFKAPFDLLENLAVWQLQRFIRRIERRSRWGTKRA